MLFSVDLTETSDSPACEITSKPEDDFNFLMEFLRDNKKAFSMVNPSLNFCEYYPGSAGNATPEKHNIDLENSIIIGDHEKDREAGRRAGIKKVIKI